MEAGGLCFMGTLFSALEQPPSMWNVGILETNMLSV